MRFLHRRRDRVAAAVVLLGLPGAWVLAGDRRGADPSVVASVKRGAFTVTVTTAGELRARQFVQMTAPPGAQQAGAYQMKISSIVPEGTVVKQGEVVAELDRSALASKLQEVTLALQKAEAQYEQAMLDSTLNLSTARENIRTMDLGLEEKRLAKEQAVYEAPTVQRQAAIDYEKAERALAQAKTDYETKTEQARAKNARGRGRRRAAEGPAQDRAGCDRGVHDQGARARNGDLCEGMERQEADGGFPGVGLGPCRRDAARPHPDGVRHVRQ